MKPNKIVLLITLLFTAPASATDLSRLDETTRARIEGPALFDIGAMKIEVQKDFQLPSPSVEADTSQATQDLVESCSLTTVETGKDPSADLKGSFVAGTPYEAETSSSRIKLHGTMDDKFLAVYSQALGSDFVRPHGRKISANPQARAAVFKGLEDAVLVNENAFYQRASYFLQKSRDAVLPLTAYGHAYSSQNATLKAQTLFTLQETIKLIQDTRAALAVPSLQLSVNLKRAGWFSSGAAELSLVCQFYGEGVRTVLDIQKLLPKEIKIVSIKPASLSGIWD